MPKTDRLKTTVIFPVTVPSGDHCWDLAAPPCAHFSLQDHIPHCNHNIGVPIEVIRNGVLYHYKKPIPCSILLTLEEFTNQSPLNNIMSNEEA